MRRGSPGPTLRCEGRSVSTAEEQQLAQLYRARRSPEFVDVPELAFLMIDGHGDPNPPEYRAALRALYSLSYAEVRVKRGAGVAYRVVPLEGLSWAATWPASRPPRRRLGLDDDDPPARRRDVDHVRAKAMTSPSARRSRSCR